MRPLGGPLSWEEETGSYGYDVEYYDYEIELSADQKDLFRSFVNDTNLLLTHLRSAECEWEFLKVALLFLRKAFFSKGLIRLLWNITALDALLREDQPGRKLYRSHR